MLYVLDVMLSLAYTAHVYVWEHATIFITLGIAVATAFWFLMRVSDPYGLFHLALNRLPSDDPSSEPSTEWLNMGLWRGARNYPEACKALALKNISAAKLKAGDRVLDVGHGTGESLLLLLSDSVPRPSVLVGITSLPLHHERSKTRVESFTRNSTKGIQTQVVLVQDDAVWRNHVASKEHPLQSSSLSSSDTDFDAILVLDCAYHFNTRRRFLEQAHERLKPGGRISLADVCFSASALQTWTSKWMIIMLQLMPSCNVISVEGYEGQMKEIGYTDVVVEDITEDVLPGFISFLKSRGAGWWIAGQIMSCYMSAGARFIIASGMKSN